MVLQMSQEDTFASHRYMDLLVHDVQKKFCSGACLTSAEPEDRIWRRTSDVVWCARMIVRKENYNDSMPTQSQPIWSHLSQVPSILHDLVKQISKLLHNNINKQIRRMLNRVITIHIPIHDREEGEPHQYYSGLEPVNTLNRPLLVDHIWYMMSDIPMLLDIGPAQPTVIDHAIWSCCMPSHLVAQRTNGIITHYHAVNQTHDIKQSGRVYHPHLWPLIIGRYHHHTVCVITYHTGQTTLNNSGFNTYTLILTLPQTSSFDYLIYIHIQHSQGVRDVAFFSFHLLHYTQATKLLVNLTVSCGEWWTWTY